METLLILVDFSSRSTHAAEYGYRLALLLKADIILVTAVNDPAVFPLEDKGFWPEDESSLLMKGSEEELFYLKNHLEQFVPASSFKPVVSCMNEAGRVTEVVTRILEMQKVDLVIMGMSAMNGYGSLFSGNHSRKMISVLTRPLLLIPDAATFFHIKRIAFATEFAEPENDLASVLDLIPLATKLNAEVMLTHIYNELENPLNFQQWIHRILLKFSDKKIYPHISYSIFKNNNTGAGLEWLWKYGNIDVLAMSHQPHRFLGEFIKRSQIKLITAHIQIPLLILGRPAHAVS